MPTAKPLPFVTHHHITSKIVEHQLSLFRLVDHATVGSRILKIEQMLCECGCGSSWWLSVSLKFGEQPGIFGGEAGGRRSMDGGQGAACSKFGSRI
ncbi:hypothetical protein T03_15934 [Trichinella britovi]|uniref:Uncharacterized protein n=1 Tax=Trichinella britovi TaxID=45882 RepID=A0A0V1CJX4_TRIBR|nr:hypothetical protein T03_15934 [Trichinella britovi]